MRDETRHAFQQYHKTPYCGAMVDSYARCGLRERAPVHQSDDIVDDKFVPFKPSSSHEITEATRALAEGHKRLDKAGVPPAQYTVCDDPSTRKARRGK